MRSLRLNMEKETEMRVLRLVTRGSTAAASILKCVYYLVRLWRQLGE